MAVNCPVCSFEMKPAALESPEYQNCYVCGSEISILPFPACFVAPKTIQAGDLERTEEETSCFYHDSKKAIHACSQCGKFLCALCAAEVGKDILCPACLVGGARKGTDERLESKRNLYDSAALILAVGPAMTVSFAIFGAPAAIYVALRYWRRPTSIVRRYAWRKYLALLLAVGELCFLGFIIVMAILQPKAPK